MREAPVVLAFLSSGAFFLRRSSAYLPVVVVLAETEVSRWSGHSECVVKMCYFLGLTSNTSEESTLAEP